MIHGGRGEVGQRLSGLGVGTSVIRTYRGN